MLEGFQKWLFKRKCFVCKNEYDKRYICHKTQKCVLCCDCIRHGLNIYDARKRMIIKIARRDILY